MTYRYHSMTDLSSYESASFDLVYSGQSIEHVTQAPGDSVLSQVRRVLKPGGFLALDTPNAKLTRLQQDAYIDPDHKYEYSHEEMAAMLRGTWLRRSSRPSASTMGASRSNRGVFDPTELATKRGVFHEIADCYLLGYVCRRPPGSRLAPLANRAAWTVTGPDAVPARARRAATRLRTR